MIAAMQVMQPRNPKIFTKINFETCTSFINKIIDNMIAYDAFHMNEVMYYYFKCAKGGENHLIA